MVGRRVAPERRDQLGHEGVRVIENRGHVTEDGVLDQLGQAVREDRGALGLPAVKRSVGHESRPCLGSFHVSHHVCVDKASLMRRAAERLALFVSANIHWLMYTDQCK